ncbi:hypothetical protein NM688_g3498 [Phlebia brevispora]|uniref:Uncharacterized protein n=1 Tax=Phlebia brevispora TaxID=194682 RepID=A0ACC1T5D5_9APHY|nr:hypothetical protein NM688_g3498 [Phlebia brevispora]
MSKLSSTNRQVALDCNICQIRRHQSLLWSTIYDYPLSVCRSANLTLQSRQCTVWDVRRSLSPLLKNEGRSGSSQAPITETSKLTVPEYRAGRMRTYEPESVMDRYAQYFIAIFIAILAWYAASYLVKSHSNAQVVWEGSSDAETSSAKPPDADTEGKSHRLPELHIDSAAESGWDAPSSSETPSADISTAESPGENAPSIESHTPKLSSSPEAESEGSLSSEASSVNAVNIEVETEDLLRHEPSLKPESDDWRCRYGGQHQFQSDLPCIVLTYIFLFLQIQPTKCIHISSVGAIQYRANEYGWSL